MAVRIVGEDATKVKRTTCVNCASLLEYTMADTEKFISRDYTGGSDIYDMLTCPKCKYGIYV